MARKPLRRACVAVCALLLLTGFCRALIWLEAPGDKQFKKGGMVLDASHAEDGYIMVKHKETKKKLKLRLINGDENYTYDLNGEGRYEVFPLQLGDGKYSARVFEQIDGTKYAQAASVSFKVSLREENAPYLCPNQYVWYREDSPVVAASREICAGLSADREKYDAIHAYILKNFTYNYVRALTVQSGYIPDLDQAFSDKMGICFDLAAIAACMLRVQGIPARLDIGYADKSYHAWNNVYLDGEVVLLDVTSELTQTDAGRYVTERSY